MKDDEAKVHAAGCDHYITKLYGPGASGLRRRELSALAAGSRP
jgi:hypothetical protein